MTYELNKNVNLHVFPTNKYKTVRLLVRFAAPLNKETSSKRSLLASLMETNSLNFPDQISLSKKLSDLYGAGFGIGVSRNGNQHYLTIGLNIINDHLVPSGTSVLESAVAFLKEIIFEPHIIDGSFDQETFNREQENLVEYIESIFDDKQTYAALSLQNLFFTHSNSQKTPSFGDVSSIESETAASIASYYQDMIRTDKVDIMVIGDVAEGYVKRVFKNFGFTDRENIITPLFYQQPFQNIIQQKMEQLPVVQSKLNLAYHCDIYYYDELYFALMIFNGLFGGFPHSKLFLNVREKHSLAYYASSSLEPFRGLVTVQTGIDGKNREKVLRLINEQLRELIAGKISIEDLDQTKVMLKNHYLLGQDSQRNLMEQAYLKLKVPAADISQEEWLQRIDQVSIEDIQEVAKHVRLQAVYFMEGEKN
ncbi:MULTISPECIES: pitrilysin family protein [Vagococcus]|uniref:Zinc protease n=1 Tax=Vagococcus fluvialis bH819 TaxID=1255619 RepID=A0A1X6WL11_9ENTE|nr:MULTISPECIES: pitrilysin family protein [Vagococcus]SLM85021.1 Zinc protease [Vagococcus fluvialis bH819]HCM88563.1 insulinase family protein [Vagococcus sp.]